MDKTEFASVLGRAFSMAASEHGLSYSDGADEAWGTVGASYLGFALCGLKSSELTSIRYANGSVRCCLTANGMICLRLNALEVRNIQTPYSPDPTGLCATVP